MKHDEKPEIVDLRRYRKAAEEAKQAKRKPPARPPSRPPQGKEPFLGSRPRAGLILAVIVLVVAALWILPALL